MLFYEVSFLEGFGEEWEVNATETYIHKASFLGVIFKGLDKFWPIQNISNKIRNVI